MRISDWSSDVCSSDLNFTVGEHTGTHFDAPVHWVSGKDLPDNSVDKVPPQQLIAPAVVLDFSAECAVDPDFLLRDAHIEDWEAKHGRIPAGKIGRASCRERVCQYV